MGAKEAEAEAAAAAAAAKLPPSVASSGSAILRVSHVVAALLKFDVDAARREETEAAGNALAAAGAGPDDVIPPPRSGADVEAERRRRRKSMGRRFNPSPDELNPVWAALGEACTVLEPQIAAAAAVAAASSRGGTAAPALPAGARQIQPVVEAYFALAAAVNDAFKRVAPPRTPHPSGTGKERDDLARAGRAGVGSGEGMVTSNAAPSLDEDDRAAFGLSVTSPAFGLAEKRDARGRVRPGSPDGSLGSSSLGGSRAGGGGGGRGRGQRRAGRGDERVELCQRAPLGGQRAGPVAAGLLDGSLAPHAGEAAPAGFRQQAVVHPRQAETARGARANAGDRTTARSARRSTASRCSPTRSCSSSTSNRRS